MSLMSWLRERVTADRAGRRLGESDAPADTGMVRDRPTGGGDEAGSSDSHSTTGTTPSDTFVGRAGGDDALDAGTSGAEARAEHSRQQPEDDDRER